MVVLNTTQETAPSSPPRDLTVVSADDSATVVNLNWQPPKQPNGQITGNKKINFLIIGLPIFNYCNSFFFFCLFVCLFVCYWFCDATFVCSTWHC
jgi:hypothetical protein